MKVSCPGGATGGFLTLFRSDALRLQRVNDFHKRKAMEVRIAGTDSPDAVLAHENGGMRVIEQIARQMRKLPDDLCGHIRVPLRG